MNVLNLFLFEHDGSILLPAQLRLRVAAFCPAPAPNFLTSLAALPEPEQPAQDDEGDAPPLTQRNTAPDALYEVVAMLRMVDQKRISVSDKTRMPGVTALRAIEGKLAN
ncbi:hypothetical protein F2P45_34575, partial [Massilia sp. CCM 8733]|nr:hypothetical protein [Massilia mucilaginosa]